MKFHLRNLWGSIGEGGEVSYWLDDTAGNKIVFNDFVGQKITIKSTREKRCRICGKKTDALFLKGACSECAKTSPRCDICMMKPELCHFEKGTCRDEEFAKNWCFNDQFIYFSVTNDLKVGYMSKENKPQRWIDQGATRAIIFANLPNRKIAGDLERYISEFEKDKTNRSRMLKGETTDVDLTKVKEKWSRIAKESWGQYITEDKKEVVLKYPVQRYPEKFKAVDLDKDNFCQGVLYGIRGQYLLFKDTVFSIRKHEGFMVEIGVEAAKEEDLLSQASLF